MNYRLSTLTLVFVVSLAADPAQAQTTPVPVPEPPLPSFALTLSPIHLFLPFVELTGEVKLSDKIGLAVIAGAGSVKANSTSGDIKVSIFEGGMSFRYYALGDFRHGMQIGAEAIYVYASASNEGISASANGATVGPFLGYKYTARGGFTFDGQLGVARMGIAGRSNAGNQKSMSEWGPLLNLNVGWSF